MSSSLSQDQLFQLELQQEFDVVLARQRARQVAAAVGFDEAGQASVATAVSEIARNAVQYARGGRVEFALGTETSRSGAGQPRKALVVTISDTGPGIAELEAILKGRQPAGRPKGLGIEGARRLMDTVGFSTAPTGTTVVLKKALRAGASPKAAAELRRELADALKAEKPDPLRELVHQNHDLIRAMDEAKSREEELARVNQELAETNAGVLALYDELETLHRISVTLASKLELKPLIQTIIDVTTVLTNATLGLFFFRDEETDRFHLYGKTGGWAEAMENFPAVLTADFFGDAFAESGLVHLQQITNETEPGPCACFLEAFPRREEIRSCLAVPVVDLNGVILGAMVFAADKPNAFSERSERILTSVATQAVVGIEKARLFQSVTAASDAKDQFLAMVSHELRTPLNPAMAVISSLCTDPRVPPELMEDLTTVWRNIRLESRLIDDLLDFNRLIKGKMEIAHDLLDVHEVIRSVIEICREELEIKAQALSTKLEAPQRTIQGDSGRLQQVLWNVLRNAIKFTPQGGRIHVESAIEQCSIKVDVIDTGRGIEPHALENIFRAFEQGSAKTGPQFGGLGLGLSIARMFVALHGGSIHATSEGPGHGACITIHLPLVAEPAPAPLPAGRPEPTGFIGKRTGRILVVDDHPDTLRTMSRLLQRQGYEVATAANGAEAHQQLATGRFDVVVSDLGLPDCSGLDLLREIREEHPVPAIALSGYGMESDLQNSAAAGFQAHLTKPVDFTELSRLVERLISAEG